MRAWWRRQPVEKRRAMIRARDPEKVRVSKAADYQRHREKRDVSARNWALRNPEKRQAQNKLNNAVRDGKVIKQTVCELADGTCFGSVEAHHPDYSKPLEVSWLCKSHHEKVHQEEA